MRVTITGKSEEGETNTSIVPSPVWPIAATMSSNARTWPPSIANVMDGSDDRNHGGKRLRRGALAENTDVLIVCRPAARSTLPVTFRSR
jgi:hypothetical protein